MNINDFTLPKNIDAKIDKEKNRIELRLNGENGGRIIAYYPIENMQIYLYEINGSHFPSLQNMGLRMSLSENNLRILICKRGHGEYSEKGVNLNLSGGEFSMRIGTEDENRFDFSAHSLLAVELVLQADDAVKESVLFKTLRTTIRSMGIHQEDFRMNQWYFSSYSEDTEKVVDRMIENCRDGADSALLLINSAEICYNLGNDYRTKGSQERKYPTNPQKAIAEDMYRQLTDNYSERVTAAMFAEKYGMSDTTVKNYFKNVYGYSYKEYQMKVRMEKAAELLTTTDKKLVEIAMSVGYATQAKFIGAFKKHYHMTPSEYRRVKRLNDILNP